jgi:uncharacterized protein YjbI with pentapeptide repeats
VANDEHIALLRQGSAVWNEWRDQNPGIVPSLHEADFSETDLSGTLLMGPNLWRANLSRTNLTEVALLGATLCEAKLVEADLSPADLTEADFSQADLTGANLTGARLYQTDLSRAKLSGTKFNKAGLYETIFGDVGLENAIGLEECQYFGPSIVDFRTLFRCADLPLSFRRGCGLPDNLIEYLPSLRGDPIKFYSCFISYSTADRLFAERLHADLHDKGVRCWFAPHDLAIGAKTWDAIDEAIRLRDKLLLILSKASIASDWVEDEVNKAFAEERSRKGIVLFPIRIDNAVISTNEPWAVKLRDQRNIGDFGEWMKPAEYDKSLERLLRDLKASGIT